MMVRISSLVFSGMPTVGFHADRNISRMQCNYCHRWCHMKFTCCRRLKVCFGCHLHGHYVANCVQGFWQRTQFPALHLVERQRSCGDVNRARKHRQGYTAGSWVSNMSRCGAGRHGRRVSNPHVGESPSRGIIGAAAASCKSQWVGPTTACKNRATAEQLSLLCWLREFQRGWHSDRPVADVALPLLAPPVVEELTVELSTALLVADVKSSGGAGMRG